MTCLDDNGLSALLSGALSAPERADIERHLDQCEPCRHLVAQMAEAVAADPSAGPNRWDAELLVPELSGRYTIGEECGRGGQARVSIAFDAVLGREIALKEPLATHTGLGEQDSPEVVRFLREARVAGQLAHPNVVPVYEIGRRADGSVYYTMQLVRGKTLAQALAEARTLVERMALLSHFLALCHAIAFAHSRGVIHRDVKPHNVMVGDFGETVVLDWGLAKCKQGQSTAAYAKSWQGPLPTTADAGGTLVGAAIGTPGYMSPEQGQGRIAEVDERSDVFGLGAVLYQILTGQPPFVGTSVAETLEQVRTGRVTPALALCPQAPVELASVAEKALARDKAARYQTAAELAAEIDDYLTGGRVRAYAYSSWELCKRFAAQNKQLVAAVAVGVVVLAVAFVAITMALRAESQARRDAERQTAEALLEGARAALSAGEVLEARAKLRTALESADSTAARALWLQTDRNPLLWSKNFGDAIHTVAISPDGRQVACGLLRGTLMLLDAVSRQLLGSWEVGGTINDLAYTPDGRTVVLSAGGRLVRFDVPTYEVTPFDSFGYTTTRIAVSHAGREVLAATREGDSLWVELHRGDLKRTLRGHLGPVAEVAIAAGDREAASAGYDGSVRLWDLASGTPRRVLAGHTDWVQTVSYDPYGELLASGSKDGSTRVWDAATGKELFALRGHQGKILAVRFSPLGGLLATGGEDTVVRLWDVATRQVVAEYPGAAETIRTIAFAADGGSMAVAALDNHARLWSLAPGQRPARGTLEGRELNRVAWSPDGTLIATANENATVGLWDAVSGELLQLLKGHVGPVIAVAFEPGGRRLASAGRDGVIRLWPLEAGAKALAVPTNHGKTHALAFGQNGRFLATANDDNTVSLWDGASLQPVRTLVGHQGPVYDVGFDRTGELLITGSLDKSLKVWKSDTGALLRTVSVTGRVFSLTAAFDDEDLVVWGDDRGQVTATHWRDQRHALLAADDPRHVTSVAAAPGGDLLAFPSVRPFGRATTVWSRAVETRFDLVDPEDVYGVAFSPEGRRLATTSEGGSLRLWDLDTHLPIWRAPALLHSPAEWLSHRGWRSLGRPAAPEGGEAWRSAIEQDARFVSQDAVGTRLCVLTFRGTLQQWDRAADQLLNEVPAASASHVVATASGCLVLDPDAARLLLAQGPSLVLAAPALAIGSEGGSSLVATASQALVFGPAGEPQGKLAIEPGATAVARCQGAWVLGFADGRITIHRAMGEPVQVRDLSPAPVTRLACGPAGTVAAGFARGLVGVWSAENGEALLTRWLHGRVSHLAFIAGTLHAVTEPGASLSWNLGLLQASRCDLLRHLARQATTVWEHGRPWQRPLDPARVSFEPCGERSSANGR